MMTRNEFNAIAARAELDRSTTLAQPSW